MKRCKTCKLWDLQEGKAIRGQHTTLGACDAHSAPKNHAGERGMTHFTNPDAGQDCPHHQPPTLN